MSFKVKTLERTIEKELLYLLKKRQWQRSSDRRISIPADGGGNAQKYILTDQQRKQIIQFFKPYVALKDTKDHEFYTARTGVFYIDYIPDWIYYAIIDPFYNDWELAKRVDNKCNYQMMFPNCRQPYGILYRMNNIWFNHDRQVVSENRISNIIEQENGFLFVKIATESCGGQGVKRCSGVKETMAAVASISGDLVIQREVKQSEVTKKLNPTSLNTVRILSVLSNKGVKVYSMILRCGVGGSFVDNASSGGITVGIEQNGRLKSSAYDKYGNMFSSHPTTQVPFSQIIIPNIEACINLVMQLHPLLPNFRMVSWDIALDEDNNPILIEANLKDGGLDVHQLNNGPIFGEDTISILEEVFSQK